MTSGFIPAPDWIGSVTGERATILDVWDGLPSLFLTPAVEGAFLWWQFDVGDDGSDYILLAHLTDDEAQAVFTSHTPDGPLEAVRAHVQDDRVIIARRHPPSGRESVHVFQIPRDYPVEQFNAWLDQIAQVLANEQLPGEARHFFLWGGPHRGKGHRDPAAVAMDKIASTVVPV